ncbi:MAG: 7-cyano-7-deazaguanine synthase [Candidatus Aminicenantales bacterium]
MEPVKNEVAVLFSGGIDSLLAAVVLQANYERVHLITFDKGYLEFGIKNNVRNVEKLTAVFGKERITHEVVNLKKLMKRIYRGLLRERKRYNMETRWCVGCRLAMNTGGLIYALEHGLAGYADGSNREQVPSEDSPVGTAENFPSIVERLRTFAGEYGVAFFTPVYDYGSREERRAKLRDLGFEIDYLSLDHSKRLKGMMTKDVLRRSQPMCFSGWLIHWKRNLLGKPIEQDEAKTLDYVILKQENVVRSYLKDYFAAGNIDLDALVQERKAFKKVPA